MNEWIYILRSFFKNSVENLELNQTIHTHTHAHSLRLKVKDGEIFPKERLTQRVSTVILASDEKKSRPNELK